MPSLTFSIRPDGIARMYDALQCLAKFDDLVSLEADVEELRLSSLNATKTAYASFRFFRDGFERYHFSTRSRTRGSRRPTWACKLQNKALSMILRKRAPTEKDTEAGVVQETAILSLDFELEAREDLAKSKLVFNFNCLSSVSKVFKLNYDSADVLHATFDKDSSRNMWVMSSKILHDTVNYFGPKTEHVDWSMDMQGKVTFTSYTEKIQNGEEILRYPTHTSVQLDDEDFDVCRIEKDLHVSVSVKDFSSLIQHAQTMKANVKASYSSGHRPAQLSYSVNNVMAEFTLMTKGTASNFGAGDEPTRSGLSVRENTPLAPTGQTESQTTSTVQTRHLQPSLIQDDAQDEPMFVGDDEPKPEQLTENTPRRSLRSNKRKPPEPPKPDPKRRQQKALPERPIDTSIPPASANPDNLFFSAPEENDQRWDPPDFDDDGQIVMWQDETRADFREDGRSLDEAELQGSERLMTSFRSGATSFNTAQDYQDNEDDPEMLGRAFEIMPTQGPLNGMNGIFDSGIEADQEAEAEEDEELN